MYDAGNGLSLPDKINTYLIADPENSRAVIDDFFVLTVVLYFVLFLLFFCIRYYIFWYLVTYITYFRQK